MPAAHHDFASRTTDLQVWTGSAVLHGWSIRESATVAAAVTLRVRDGTADTAPVVAVIEIAADGDDTQYFDKGIFIGDGVFMEVAAGEVEGVFWLG